nr:hypothetical protein CFP56_13469 [Quercus suber]
MSKFESRIGGHEGINTLDEVLHPHTTERRFYATLLDVTITTAMCHRHCRSILGRLSKLRVLHCTSGDIEVAKHGRDQKND